MLCPQPEETAQRDRVLAAVARSTRAGEAVRLPAYDASRDRPGLVALASVGIEENEFGGTVGGFRYQFEGEDDLLHLFVCRQDGAELAPEEARAVAAFAMPGIAPGLVWFKPGTLTQHFYCGHDDLVAGLPD